MKILVTGGCGFIGSNFVFHQIRSTENTILNFDKLTYAGNLDNLSEIAQESRYSFIQGDICEYSLVRKTFADFQPDAVVHLAAESHVDRSIDGPMDFVSTNIMGTATLLNVSREYLKFACEYG